MTTVPKPVAKAPISVLRGPLRDVSNIVTQGSGAPKAQERIWIDPRQLTRIYVRNATQTPDFKRRHSGMVIDGDWDTHTEPLDQSWKIAACLAHFQKGMSWEETGVYAEMAQMISERGQFDSCRTEDDVQDRYHRIDALYEDIRLNGYRDDTVVKRGTPRLPEGVFVHIDRNGDPIFGAIGNHRVGIARALELPSIPAQLGVVHPEAIAGGALIQYRDPGS